MRSFELKIVLKIATFHFFNQLPKITLGSKIVGAQMATMYHVKDLILVPAAVCPFVTLCFC